MAGGAHRAPEKVSLRDHMMALLAAADLRHEQRYQAQEQAVRNALASIGARLDLLNESRATINDAVSRQVSSDKFDATIHAQNSKIEDLKEYVDKTSGGRAGALLGWQLLTGAALLGLALYAAFHR